MIILCSRQKGLMALEEAQSREEILTKIWDCCDGPAEKQ